MKKNLLLMITISFFAFGCQNQATPPENETPPAVEQTETPGEVEPPEEPSQDLVDELNVILSQQETGAAEIGLFIREQAATASASEMERMIEMLMLHQASLAEEVNQKIHTQAYMKALNGTMGGALTPEKVDDIENADARKDFQQLVDAHMKVVRYEETPVAETDWEALKAYDEAVSENFSRLVILWEKMQNNRYGRQEVDFEKIIQDLVETEGMIKANEVSFLTWQLNRLYDRQVAALFVGPEGSYLDTFISKNSDLYMTLVKGASDYPNSRFAQLVITLEDANTTDFQILNDLILNFNVFGGKGDGKIVEDRLDGGESFSGLSYVRLPQEAEKEKAINDLINQVAESMELPEETAFNNHFYDATDHYLSLAVYASYSSEEGEFKFREEMVTINLDSMERETLRYMLEREGDNVSITEMFATAPYDIDNFVIDGPVLRLKWRVEGQAQEEDGRLWFYELEPYVSLDKLYR
jgi:hypothetical protein